MGKKKKKTKEEKAAEAAEKAELQAIADEEARIEAERLEAERLRLEAEAQAAADVERESELTRLAQESDVHAPGLAARAAQISGIDAAVAARADWAVFVVCDPSPTVSDEAQINTKVLEWESQTNADACRTLPLSETVATASAGATKILGQLELLRATALENHDNALLAYSLQKARDVHRAVSGLIDVACADALEAPFAKLPDAEEMKPKKRQIDFVAKQNAAAMNGAPSSGDQMRFGLWAQTDASSKGRGRMKISFPQIGIHVKLPKSISAGQQGQQAVRAAYWPVDTVTASTVPDSPGEYDLAPAAASLADYDATTVALATAKYEAWRVTRPSPRTGGPPTTLLESGETVALAVKKSLTSSELRPRALDEVPWGLQRIFVGKALYESKWVDHVAAPPAVAVIGGVFSIELLTIPPNARRMKTWAVRLIDDGGATSGLQLKAFPGDGALAAHMLPINVDIKFPTTVLIGDVKDGDFDKVRISGAVAASAPSTPAPSAAVEGAESTVAGEGDAAAAEGEAKGDEANADGGDAAADGSEAEKEGGDAAPAEGEAVSSEEANAASSDQDAPASIAIASESAPSRIAGTRLAWRNPKTMEWDTSVISDVQWDAAGRTLAFATMRTGTFAVIQVRFTRARACVSTDSVGSLLRAFVVLFVRVPWRRLTLHPHSHSFVWLLPCLCYSLSLPQPRNSELPFKSWSVEPMETADLSHLAGAGETECATVLVVEGQNMTFHFGVGDGDVRLLGPDIPEMAGLRLKAMRPGTMLAALAQRGVYLAPSLEDMAHFGIPAKKASVERAANFEISLLASG